MYDESEASIMPLLEARPSNVIRELEATLGLSSQELAVILGTDQRTVERWRADGSYPQGKYRAQLVELYQLRQRLLENFTNVEAIQGWLRTPSLYLGGHFAPIDALRLGRFNLVTSDLDGMESGVLL